MKLNNEITLKKARRGYSGDVREHFDCTLELLTNSCLRFGFVYYINQCDDPEISGITLAEYRLFKVCFCSVEIDGNNHIALASSSKCCVA
jgi:hypothetical protein